MNSNVRALIRCPFESNSLPRSSTPCAHLTVRSTLDFSVSVWDGPEVPNNKVELQNCSVKQNSFVLAEPNSESTEKMNISGKQIAAARELLGITQPELAAAAGVSDKTILNFETNKSEPYPATLAKIRLELERRGIEFTNGDGAGVRINYAKAAEFARLSAPTRNESDR